MEGGPYRTWKIEDKSVKGCYLQTSSPNLIYLCSCMPSIGYTHPPMPSSLATLSPSNALLSGYTLTLRCPPLWLHSHPPMPSSLATLSPSDALLSPQLWCALPEGTPPAHSGLHTHLHRLHWAEGNVCKELGTSRGSQVETGTIEIGILLRLGEEIWILLHQRDPS